MTDERVLTAWEKNAAPWTDAVRESRIASRALVTNQAIIDAVVSRSPKRILDVGCGEGWLVRELAAHGIEGIGVDAIPELIAKAAQAGGGEFRIASYEDIAAGQLHVRVDAVIANFSLIGKESVDALIRRSPQLLRDNGWLIVQTLHPLTASPELPYADGWREGSWVGCGDGFGEAAPWFFRTLGSWVKVIRDSGFTIEETREPVHPETGRPASIIFLAARAREA